MPSLARLVSLCSNEISYLWKRLINIAQTEENHSFWSGFLLPAPGERSCWCSGGHSCSRCFWESSTMHERNALKLWHEFWNKQRVLGFLHHPWSQGKVMSSHCHPNKTEEFKTVFFFNVLKPHFTHPWQVLHLGQYWAFIAIFIEYEVSSWTLLPNLGREINVRAFFSLYCLEKVEGWDSFHSTVAGCMGKVPSYSFSPLLFSFLPAPLFQSLSPLPPPQPLCTLPSSWYSHAALPEREAELNGLEHWRDAS